MFPGFGQQKKTNPSPRQRFLSTEVERARVRNFESFNGVEEGFVEYFKEKTNLQEFYKQATFPAAVYCELHTNRRTIKRSILQYYICFKVAYIYNLRILVHNI